MKSIRMMTIVFALAAVLPGAAHATHWDLSRSAADCEGWNADLALTWVWNPDRDVCANVITTVELVGPQGTFTTTSTETLCRSTTGETKNYTKSWSGDYGLTMAGTYTATITLVMQPDYGGYDDVDVIGPFTFTCDAPGDACHYTPGYWKNHPENWPLMELSLGGRIYSQAELLRIMDTPVRGDATIILAYHTIAAKLNVAGGAESSSIASALSSADAVFATYGIGHGISPRDRATALAAKDILAGYNEMECSGVVRTTSTADKLGEPGDEAATWGAVKGLYR